MYFQVREEEKNQRQDLFTLATSYSGQLKAKSASMIRENDFHQVSDKVILHVALVSKEFVIWVVNNIQYHRNWSLTSAVFVTYM